MNTFQVIMREKDHFGLSYVLRKGYTKGVSAALSPISRHILRVEFENQNPGPRPDSKPLQYAFALKALSHSQFQDVLDVGTGRSAWPALLAPCGYHLTAVDEMRGYWGGRFLNRHFYLLQDDITEFKSNEQFGIITCLYTLQHIREHARAVANMARLLKPQGILILTFPYNEERYVPNAYALPESGYGQDAPYICQICNRETLNDWAKQTDLELIEQRYYKVFTGDFWSVGTHLRPPEEVTVDQLHHLTGVVFRRVSG